MNGFTENAASGAFDKPDRRDELFTLEVARQMLPLVQRVADDILEHRRRLARLVPEQERLDRERHSLLWPDRRRRYQLQDEIAREEHHYLDTLAELEVLGLDLIDPREGQLGFPTIVNDRPAYFSWRPGEEEITSWHFADEIFRRRIPNSWSKLTEGVRKSR